MNAGERFDALVAEQIAQGYDRAEAIHKVADSPAGRKLLLEDRQQASADAEHRLEDSALEVTIAKRREIEDLIDIGARQVSKSSNGAIGEQEALETFLKTDVGRVLYEALTGR